MKHPTSIALAALFFLGVTPSAAESELREVGEPIVDGSLQSPSVEALDPQGRFVLVWQDPGLPERVLAQRHAWSGPIADPFVIAEDASVDMRDTAPSGRFLVVWRDSASTDRGARLFEPDTTPVDSSFDFPPTPVPAHRTSMSLADDGQFVLVWKVTSGLQWQLERQRFDPSGAPLETPFVVEDLRIEYYYSPLGTTEVDHAASGEFVIAWDEFPPLDEYCYSWYAIVQRQRFDADGFVAGDRFWHGYLERSPQTHVSVAISPNGTSITTFAQDSPDCNGGYGNYVVVSRNSPQFDTGISVEINTGDFERLGRSAINAHAEFVVAWQVALDYGSSRPTDLRAQLHDPAGRPVGQELQLADDPAVSESLLDVQMNDNGQVLTRWRESGVGEIVQRLCFDPALALITTGAGGARLRVADLPQGTTRYRFGLPPGQSTIPGIEAVPSPHGRLAIVATSGAGSALSVFEIADGVTRPEIGLGADRSLVPGVAPVLAGDDGSLALVANQQIATGEPRLHVVDPWSGDLLRSVATGTPETLVPEIAPTVVSDGWAALLATNLLDGVSAVLRRIDLESGSVTSSLPLGPGERFVRGVGPVPTTDGAIVVLATNSTTGGAPSVRVLDPADLSVDGTFALDPGSMFQRGVSPIVAENGLRAIVATQGAASRVRILDLTAPSIDTVIDLASDDGMVDDVGFVRGPDGNIAVLATRSPAGVWLRTFDLAAGVLVHEVLLPGRGLVAGVGPRVSPRGKHAYLLTAGSPVRIDRIDLTTGLADTPLLLDATEEIEPGVDLRLASDESVLLVATKNVTNTGTVLRLLDPATLAVLHRLDFGPGEQPARETSIVETRCGFVALLSTQGSQGEMDTVRVIDLATGEVTRARTFSASERLVPGVGPVLPASSVAGDCNANLREDSEDVAQGASDCDLDGVPDECQPDCNANEVADTCDVASGDSDDRDRNGVPDECQPDCNANELLDDWEISNGLAADCNGDWVPDECDPDCNANQIPDGCDIFDMTSDDCNRDGIPDECQPGLDSDLDGHLECSDNCPLLANPIQSDFDMDGVGDVCDPDDDNDGVGDLLDNCRIAVNTDQLNTDADPWGDACDDDDDNDGVLDVLDNCGVIWNTSQTNADGDPRGDACDCDHLNDGAWSAPTEARELTFQTPILVSWSPPGELGGGAVLYDLLRSTGPSDFVNGACEDSNIAGLSTATLHPTDPGDVDHYLIRPKNACPGGQTLGSYSDGTPRVGPPCP